MNDAQIECLKNTSEITLDSVLDLIKSSNLFKHKEHEAITSVMTGILSALTADIVEEELEDFLVFICDIIRKNYYIIAEVEKKL